MDEEKKDSKEASQVNILIGLNPALGIATPSTANQPEEQVEPEEVISVDANADDEYASGRHRLRCARKRDFDKERRKRKAAKVSRRRNR